MTPFFSPNIGTGGRVARALMALGLFIGGGFAWDHSIILAVVLFAGAGFALFEAVRGWCLLRACGVKTKL